MAGEIYTALEQFPNSSHVQTVCRKGEPDQCVYLRSGLSMRNKGLSDTDSCNLKMVRLLG